MPRRAQIAQAPAPQQSPSVGDFMKMGFGFGIGSIAATIIFILVAMCFFVPGFIIVMKQHKKEKEKRSTGWLIFGYILMAIGVIVGIGFGAGIFLTTLSEDL